MSKFKKGDKVVMHSCGEADFEMYHGKIWTCRDDSYMNNPKSPYAEEVVFLEGFSSHFCCEFLQLVKIEKEENKRPPSVYLEELKSWGQIKEGDNLILLDSSYELEVVQIKKVKISESDGEEVIFNMKENKFFNVGMCLEGSSWVELAYIIKNNKYES